MILSEREILLFSNHGELIGIDEVGRGPLAGPVVVTAIAIDLSLATKLAKGVDDSKKLSPKRREQITNIVLEENIRFATIEKSSTEIDSSGIVPATQNAMNEAHAELSLGCRTVVDGRFKNAFAFKNYEEVIGADRLFVCVALASVVAKVHRDALMVRQAKKFPEYGFEKHMGYGTKDHIQAIQTHGSCEIHRKSFNPIREMLEKTQKATGKQ